MVICAAVVRQVGGTRPYPFRETYLKSSKKGSVQSETTLAQREFGSLVCGVA